MSCTHVAPDASTEDMSPPSRPVPPDSAGRIRVLVVDDDPRVRSAVSETIALEADLIVVGDAADAGSALTTATAVGPAVALVDILLPDSATGLTLVHELTRGPRCAVVAMSVRSALRDAALAAGAVAFVEKGDDIDALLRSVRAAAARTGGSGPRFSAPEGGH